MGSPEAEEVSSDADDERADDDDEAIALANATRYGLSASVFTKVAVPEMLRHGYAPRFTVRTPAGMPPVLSSAAAAEGKTLLMGKTI